MKPYYEGWYMKQQQGEDVLAVIPGRAQDSAFIQVVSNRGSRFLPYPLERSTAPTAACESATACSRRTECSCASTNRISSW